MSVIRAINRQSVHQICSGQVILDLATAVKELLENALDAETSSIEIKLKDYGISSIEVSDNGQGIEEANYEGLTKKHHTSKLQDFSDLTSVETFGFRGEALSSLCALSDMTVTTRFKTRNLGHRLEYDHDGKLTKKASIARQAGTSVILRNLFVPLPVRHVEFEKNIKREFSKLVNLLYSYCVICTDVKICCSNEVKGVKREVFRTSGSKSTQDCIVTLFGSKLFKSLVQFEQAPPTEETCENYRLSHKECLDFSEDCVITGYISSCGSGRRSSDMQYISVNKRPCHVPKFCKLINEIFRLFNKKQYPFVQLDILTKRDQVDINVTPDKRQVFLTHEKALLAILKSSLLKVYNGMSHKIETLVPRHSILSQLKCNDKRKLSASFTDIKTSRYQSVNQSPSIPNCSSIPNKAGRLRNIPDVHLQILHPSDIDGAEVSALREKHNVAPLDTSIVTLSEIKCANQVRVDTYDEKQELHAEGDPCSSLDGSPASGAGNDEYVVSHLKTPTCSKNTDNALRPLNVNNMHGISDQSNETGDQTPPKHPKQRTINHHFISVGLKKIDCAENFHKSHCPLSFSFPQLRNKWDLKTKIRDRKDGVGNVVFGDGNFQAKIVSSQNDKAEKELSKYFCRESFKNMKILGQFNLGFIIAKHGKDLFIVDQHASDEKYNFEMLQKTTKLNGQPLIVPQKLELTASDVMVLEDNMEIFVQNGFSFDIKESDLGMKSVFLLKVPSSKNLVFDVSDVAELIFILRDHPHTLCRPSRIQQMFASRACRKSIMIGSPLTFDAMKQIVSHMSEMEQPWNCPHGRPTMRHLIDLAMIAKSDLIS